MLSDKIAELREQAAKIKGYIDELDDDEKANSSPKAKGKVSEDSGPAKTSENAGLTKIDLIKQRISGISVRPEPQPRNEQPEEEAVASDSGSDGDFLNFDRKALTTTDDSYDVSLSHYRIMELFDTLQHEERVEGVEEIAQWFDSRTDVSMRNVRELESQEDSYATEMANIDAAHNVVTGMLEMRDMHTIERMKLFYDQFRQLGFERVREEVEREHEDAEDEDAAEDLVAAEDQEGQETQDIEDPEHARGDKAPKKEKGAKAKGKSKTKAGEALEKKRRESEEQDIASQLLDVIAKQHDEIAHFRAKAEMCSKQTAAHKAALDFLRLQEEGASNLETLLNADPQQMGDNFNMFASKGSKRGALTDASYEVITDIAAQVKTATISQMLQSSEGRKILSGKATRHSQGTGQKRLVDLAEETQKLTREAQELEAEFKATPDAAARMLALQQEIAVYKHLQVKETGGESPAHPSRYLRLPSIAGTPSEPASEPSSPMAAMAAAADWSAREALEESKRIMKRTVGKVGKMVDELQARTQGLQKTIAATKERAIREHEAAEKGNEDVAEDGNELEELRAEVREARRKVEVAREQADTMHNEEEQLKFVLARLREVRQTEDTIGLEEMDAALKDIGAAMQDIDGVEVSTVEPPEISPSPSPNQMLQASPLPDAAVSTLGIPSKPKKRLARMGQSRRLDPASPENQSADAVVADHAEQGSLPSDAPDDMKELRRDLNVITRQISLLRQREAELMRLLAEAGLADRLDEATKEQFGFFLGDDADADRDNSWTSDGIGRRQRGDDEMGSEVFSRQQTGDDEQCGGNSQIGFASERTNGSTPSGVRADRFDGGGQMHGKPASPRRLEGQHRAGTGLAMDAPHKLADQNPSRGTPFSSHGLEGRSGGHRELAASSAETRKHGGGNADDPHTPGVAVHESSDPHDWAAAVRGGVIGQRRNPFNPNTLSPQALPRGEAVQVSRTRSDGAAWSGRNGEATESTRTSTFKSLHTGASRLDAKPCVNLPRHAGEDGVSEAGDVSPSASLAQTASVMSESEAVVVLGTINSTQLVDVRDAQIRELLQCQKESEKLEVQLITLEERIRQAKLAAAANVKAVSNGGARQTQNASKMDPNLIPEENKQLRREVVRRQRELNKLRQRWAELKLRPNTTQPDVFAPGQVEAAVRMLLREPPARISYQKHADASSPSLTDGESEEKEEPRQIVEEADLQQSEVPRGLMVKRLHRRHSHIEVSRRILGSAGDAAPKFRLSGHAALGLHPETLHARTSGSSPADQYERVLRRTSNSSGPAAFPRESYTSRKISGSLFQPGWQERRLLGAFEFVDLRGAVAAVGGRPARRLDIIQRTSPGPEDLTLPSGVVNTFADAFSRGMGVPRKSPAPDHTGSLPLSRKPSPPLGEHAAFFLDRRRSKSRPRPSPSPEEDPTLANGITSSTHLGPSGQDKLAKKSEAMREAAGFGKLVRAAAKPKMTSKEKTHPSTGPSPGAAAALYPYARAGSTEPIANVKDATSVALAALKKHASQLASADSVDHKAQ